MKKISLSIFLCTCLLSPLTGQARETLESKQIFKAKVLTIISEEKVYSEATQSIQSLQYLEVSLLTGDKKGESAVVENDYMPMKVGQKIFIQKIINPNTQEAFFVLTEPDRTGSMIFFLVLFLLVLIIFGGFQGVRGLISLIGSLVLIVYLLIPGLLAGYSPIFISLIVSSVIIIFGSFVTHGFNKTTLAAVCGMIITICFTGLLAYISVKTTYLSGYAAEESVYLQANALRNFDIQGLLLSGFLIGLLGILYDAAISQAIVIEELRRANSTMTIKELYKRGIRVGREHIGALVDTLAIAYVGASLPLLLLLAHTTTGEPIFYLLNREVFATEIIRTLIGSIGLMLTVPLTTYISVMILKNVTFSERAKSNHVHHHS